MAHVGSHVTVGKSKRVHKLRPGTVYSRRDYFTTWCGYYGRPQEGGWMQETMEAVTCKTCSKRP